LKPDCNGEKGARSHRQHRGGKNRGFCGQKKLLGASKGSVDFKRLSLPRWIKGRLNSMARKVGDAKELDEKKLKGGGMGNDTVLLERGSCRVLSLQTD